MPKSFYIIDGHAHIYRAYFAPFRDLSSPSGEPTKATFVFTQMLVNLIQQRKPDYLAMVIDQGGDEGVFRKEIYPEYKANRQAPPPDFEPQERRILQIVKDAGVPIFAKPGFEADDLIATMAKRLCQQDFETFIVSKDKDLRQVLTPCVKMYDPQADEVMDIARMEEKCGYGPAEAVEVQTLMGDAIDNVPGIPGVGEKTAAKLIKKYGSAEAVLQHVEELTPKMRENFQQYAGNIPLARELVRLRDDVEMLFEPETCRFEGLKIDAVRADMEALGFHALLRRLGGGQPATPVQRTAPAAPKFEEGLFGSTEPAPAQVNIDASARYQLVDTDEKFDAFLAELKQQKRFAFDTETDALGAMNSQLIGMSFSWEHGTGWYVAIKGPADCVTVDAERALAALRPILEDSNVKKVGHNIKYDLMVMQQAGIDFKGIELDTMIAAFILDAARLQYGIDALALSLLNYKKIPTVDIIGKGKQQVSMSCVELAKVADYACEDADIALRLADLLGKKLDELPELRKLADEVETPLIEVLAEMETNGVAIDENILQEQSSVLSERVGELRQQIMNSAGVEFNPDSPKQLGEILFNRLALRVVKRTKTGPSTDIEVLEKLANEHPVPKFILEYRSLVKLKNTYLDNLTNYVNRRTGRIHGHFNQAGAITGRLSMSDPNLQNIPIRTDEGRRIRLAFVPGDAVNNVLLTADYSQIELRVLAHFTREPALVRAFEADEDIHLAVASEVFNVPLGEVTREQRGYAKIVNFGIIYGVTAYGLARRIEGLTVSSAGELITAYNKRFPTIQQFLHTCVEEAQANGYVKTILGRRRPILEINSGTATMRNEAERMAINGVVQGSAADMIKIAMLHVRRQLVAQKMQSKMILQVHDELVFETPESVAATEADIIRKEMTAAMTLAVPLKVEVGWGKNWQEGK